jgi:hypothetical protein
MNFESLFGAGLLLLSAVCFCAFFGQRALARRRKRQGHLNPGFFPSGTYLGNALHQLQSIVDPEVVYSIQQDLHEADEDEDGYFDPQKASPQTGVPHPAQLQTEFDVTPWCRSPSDGQVALLLPQDSWEMRICAAKQPPPARLCPSWR